MTTLDFSPLYRTMIGFDRLLPWFENAAHLSDGGFPPYNVEKVDDEHYRITMAVAGFDADELSVESHDDVLTVKGASKQDEEGRSYLYRGIAGRAFSRTFQLADYVKVSDARLDNGLLHIDLVREVPEEMKPRRIEIRSGQGRLGSRLSRLIEGSGKSERKGAEAA
jgi:molecular chaperone IbpA